VNILRLLSAIGQAEIAHGGSIADRSIALRAIRGQLITLAELVKYGFLDAPVPTAVAQVSSGGARVHR
jgi:hypothetical protein